MTSQVAAYNDNNQNPLDSVEDVLSDYNWVYSRMNNDNLIVEIAGKSCSYRLLFIWQEHMNALQFSCQFDVNILPENKALLAGSIMDINSSLWMGHFELTKESMNPCFRQTCLIHEQGNKKEYAYIEDLVDISLVQCERYYPVFNLLSSETDIDIAMLSLAMMETAGES